MAVMSRFQTGTTEDGKTILYGLTASVAHLDSEDVDELIAVLQAVRRGEISDGPSDEDRDEYAELIADHLSAYNREAVVATVALVTGDARLETRRLLERPGPMTVYKVEFTRAAEGKPPLPLEESWPCITLLQDGGMVQTAGMGERQIHHLITTAVEVLGRLVYRREQLERERQREEAASG